MANIVLDYTANVRIAKSSRSGSQLWKALVYDFNSRTFLRYRYGVNKVGLSRDGIGPVLTPTTVTDFMILVQYAMTLCPRDLQLAWLADKRWTLSIRSQLDVLEGAIFPTSEAPPILLSAVREITNTWSRVSRKLTAIAISTSVFMPAPARRHVEQITDVLKWDDIVHLASDHPTIRSAVKHSPLRSFMTVPYYRELLASVAYVSKTIRPVPRAPSSVRAMIDTLQTSVRLLIALQLDKMMFDIALGQVSELAYPTVTQLTSSLRQLREQYQHIAAPLIKNTAVGQQVSRMYTLHKLRALAMQGLCPFANPSTSLLPQYALQSPATGINTPLDVIDSAQYIHMTYDINSGTLSELMGAIATRPETAVGLQAGFDAGLPIPQAVVDLVKSNVTLTEPELAVTASSSDVLGAALGLIVDTTAADAFIQNMSPNAIRTFNDSIFGKSLVALQRTISAQLMISKRKLDEGIKYFIQQLSVVYITNAGEFQLLLTPPQAPQAPDASDKKEGEEAEEGGIITKLLAPDHMIASSKTVLNSSLSSKLSPNQSQIANMVINSVITQTAYAPA